MRKLTLFVVALFATSMLSAQLRIGKDGRAHLGYNGGYPELRLGSYYASGEDNGEWGLEVMYNGFNLYKPYPSPNAGNYYFYVSRTGLVGMGKDPGYKLDVNGDICTRGRFLELSDERLKSNIAPLDGYTDRLLSLQPKTYFKKLPPVEIDTVKFPNAITVPNAIAEQGEIEFGFLAQELKNYFPELVDQDKDGYYTINYIGLIPVIVETLQKQQETIDYLISQNSNRQMVQNAISNMESFAANDVARLEQNIPNPFSTITEIKYYLPEGVTTAYLIIYDMQGKQLKQILLKERKDGSQIISGSEFGPGIYLYALLADGKEVDIKRMILTQ